MTNIAASILAECMDTDDPTKELSRDLSRITVVSQKIIERSGERPEDFVKDLWLNDRDAFYTFIAVVETMNDDIEKLTCATIGFQTAYRMIKQRPYRNGGAGKETVQ